MSDKVTLDFLKSHLWKASDILRGSLDSAQYRQPVMTILFLKRLNDTFEENAQLLIAQGKDKKKVYTQKFLHKFFVPESARWDKVSSSTENIGQVLDKVCRDIEDTNPLLEGVLTNIKYNDKKKYPDDRLRQLVAHFNQPPLANSNLEKEDVFGDAYEYLLEKFADAAKKTGGEFFTPREIVQLLVNITKPQEGMKIYDPTCGSGGMLVLSRNYIQQHKGDPENLTLDGQEFNYDTLGMCKMNLVLHGLENFNILQGDTLADPKHTDNGSLKKYDRILANFPFSMNWDNSTAESDPYSRFVYGIPPAKDKADYAFILHMLASLNEKGQAGIVCSQGVLFRSGEEGKIRKNMILGNKKEGIIGDVIEAIIALPQKMFWGTGIPACIMILNKNKPAKRKNKILFIYGAKDFEENKNKNNLRDIDIKKIVTAFENFEDVEKYCHVADIAELEENEFNLNVPRYVDISEPEEPIDIQEAYDELKKSKSEQGKLEKLVEADLKELNIKL
jgi:type I restriction enzyme M protein